MVAHAAAVSSLGLQDYEQAIRLKPDAAAAFNNLGNAYAAKKAYDRAIQDYEQARALDGQTPYECLLAKKTPAGVSPKS